MDTAKARRFFNVYAQIQAKLKVMEQKTELKNKAHQEARRKLTEALDRLEVVVNGLPGLPKPGKPIGRAPVSPRHRT